MPEAPPYIQINKKNGGAESIKNLFIDLFTFLRQPFLFNLTVSSSVSSFYGAMT